MSEVEMDHMKIFIGKSTSLEILFLEGIGKYLLNKVYLYKYIYVLYTAI